MAVSDDPSGAQGAPYLKALAWWLTAAAILLLLPRQWPSAGIALGLGLLLHGIHAYRQRTAARPDHEAPGEARTR